MRILPSLLGVLLLCLPMGGRAQESPVVIELFTSQGCTSCPPADALLARLAREPGVIPLALHVDYWDYLGWQDSFGQPAFTHRQRAYGKMSRKRLVYTPQMIVQGEDILIGHDADAIRARIAAHRAKPPSVSIRLDRQGDTLRIHLAPIGAEVGVSDVQVVRYIPEQPVMIEGGENAGQMITYTNIATEWQLVGRWDGRSEADLAVEGVGDDPLAVIVQRERHGPILTAARLDQ